MSNLPKIISLLLLIVSLHSSAQYKHMSVGLSVGTNKFSYNYVSSDLIVQYNFKKIFSVNTGLGFEQAKFTTQDFYDFPYGFHITYKTSTINAINIPLAFKMTLGKHVFLYAMAGIQFYYNTKDHQVLSMDYTSDIHDTIIESVNYFQPKWSFAPFYGAGINVPISKRLNLFLECKQNLWGSKLIFGENNFESYHDYRYFNGFRFMFGAMYQFNFRKKSEFTFTAPYPAIRKNEN